MPWNGTGTYTRGYASWTSDASNGLPISATKFDTEDNDFAAGIQNCLTIDGQNKPNATLTWAQALALTKGADSTVFSIARTGGTNNPSLTWAFVDATNAVTAALVTGQLALTFKPGTYTFGNTGDNPAYFFAGSGSFGVGGGVSLETTAGAFNIANASAAMWSLTNTSAALNQKLWEFFADASGVFHARLVNDADNAAVDWQTVTRTGVTSAIVAFPNSVVQISDNAASPSLFAAGYLGLPQNQQNINYTTVLADQAKQLYHSSGSAHTFTIAANASVAYPIGTILHFVNEPGAGVLTIAINTDSLTLVPAGSTGSRTLTAPGVASAEKYATGSWIIYGSNLT